MRTTFKASNDLEEVLVKMQDNEDLFVNFITLLLHNEIIVPSRKEIINGEFDPLLFKKENTHMMTAFTSLPLIEIYKNKIKQYMFIEGREVLKQLPENVGIVINPGYEVGFDISPNGIKQILKDF